MDRVVCQCCQRLAGPVVVGDSHRVQYVAVVENLQYARTALKELHRLDGKAQTAALNLLIGMVRLAESAHLADLDARQRKVEGGRLGGKTYHDSEKLSPEAVRRRVRIMAKDLGNSIPDIADAVGRTPEGVRQILGEK